MRQRRRSRLEEGHLTGASVWSVRRYVLLTAVAVISLALPAALTFRPSATTRRKAGGGAAENDGGGQKPSLVDVEHDAWLGIAPGIATSPASVDDIHVVFSTDCSPYQTYQATLLFNSAEVIWLYILSLLLMVHSIQMLFICLCSSKSIFVPPCMQTLPLFRWQIGYASYSSR